MENLYKLSKRSLVVLVTMLAVIIAGSLVFPRAMAARYTEKDTDILYTNEKVVMKNMPVKDWKTGNLVKDPIKYTYWDATTQEFQGEVTSVDGIIPDLELFKGHHYIFYVEDVNYISYHKNTVAKNTYLSLDKTGEAPTNDRWSQSKEGDTEKVEAFFVKKRINPISEEEAKNDKRVLASLDVGLFNGTESDVFDGTTVVFTSDFETIKVPIRGIGTTTVSADLVEDAIYTVTVESDKYTLEPLPLTIKDHSHDYGYKGQYTHFSCSPIAKINLRYKNQAKTNTLTSTDGKTSLSGSVFPQDDYILRKRVVNQDVPSLKGKDYQVVDIDTINLYRNELSKLTAGEFKITTDIPDGKTVLKVYYIDKSGALHKVPHTQKGNQVTFDTNTVGVYNNVILFDDGNTQIGYDVTVEAGQGGKATASPAKAEEGDTVTVTVTPDSGYKLTHDTVTVTDASDKKVEVTKVDNKTYKFAMPASNAKVKADFEKDTGSAASYNFQIDGWAKWIDAKTITLDAVDDEFELTDESISHIYLKRNDSKIYLTDKDSITRNGKTITIKLNDDYSKYKNSSEFIGFDIGAVVGKNGGAMTQNKQAQFTALPKFEFTSISYDKEEVEYNAGEFVATVKGKNFAFAQNVLRDFQFNVYCDDSQEWDIVDSVEIKIVDDSTLKLTVKNVPNNDTDKDQLWNVEMLSKNWQPIEMEGTDLYVKVLSKKSTPPAPPAKFDISIDGFATWIDAQTVEFTMNRDDFKIVDAQKDQIYFTSKDGEKLHLSADDILTKDGKKITIKLKNKTYRDYREYNMYLFMPVGTLQSEEGGDMNAVAKASVVDQLSPVVDSITYDKTEISYNGKEITATIKGKNFLFAEGNESRMRPDLKRDEVAMPGPKLDWKIVDDNTATVTFSNLPENTTDKDQKWKIVMVKNFWAPISKDTQVVTMKAKGSVTPEVKPFVLKLEASPEAGGTVGGAGSYKPGEKAKLSATPAKGYKFVRWTREGNDVSRNPNPEIDVTDTFAGTEMTLVAEFEKENPVTPPVEKPYEVAQIQSNWTSVNTIEVKISDPDFTIADGAVDKILLSSFDGSQRLNLPADSKLEKQGDVLRITLGSGKTFKDYNTCTELSLQKESIADKDGNLLSKQANGHLNETIKFTVDSLTYDKTDIPYNEKEISATITGDNFFFGEQEGTYKSIQPQLYKNGNFFYNNDVKFEVKVIDNKHAKITVKGLPENTTDKPIDWRIKIYAGYSFERWNDTGTEAKSFVKMNPKSGQPAVQPFELMLEASPANGGTVTGAGKYNPGENIKLNATPANGYRFVKWTKEDGSTLFNNAENEINVPDAYAGKSLKLVAVFEAVAAPKQYKVSFDANGGSGSMDAVTVEEGKSYILPDNKFDAPEGKEFKCWSVDGTEKNPGDEILVAGNTSVMAVWKDAGQVNPPATKTYDLSTVVSGGHGKISDSQTGLAEGSTATVTFTPDADYEIDNVTVNGQVVNVTGNTLTLTMDENKAVTVTYKAVAGTGPVVPSEKAKLTFKFAGGAWADGSTSRVIEANIGDIIKIPEAPVRDGYIFVEWRGSSYQPGDDFKVEGDHTFTAIWKKIGSTGDNDGHHTASTDNKGNKNSKGSPMTGDNSETAIMLLLMAMCVAGLTGETIVRRRFDN